MKARQRRIRGWTLVLTSLLSGGTLFGTCEMRVRDALVDGSKTFVFTLFDQFAPVPGDTTTP